MEVTLIGMGLGDPPPSPPRRSGALEGADGLIRARRLVEGAESGT